MAKRKTQQVGGKKEVPIAVVDRSGGGQEQHRQVCTPKDAEFQRYSELLKGFFEKFTRWQAVLKTDVYEDKERYMNCFLHEETWAGSVFRVDTDLIMTPATSLEEDDPQNKILQIRSEYMETAPEVFNTEFLIRPAPAGKQLLFDPKDGMPLTEIRINVLDNTKLVGFSQGSKSLLIATRRPEGDPQNNRDDRELFSKLRRVDYSFQENTLRVSHKFNTVHDVMTDEMAIYLINTIDALIPGSTIPTQKQERRTNIEISAPKALPPERRRTSRG